VNDEIAIQSLSFAQRTKALSELSGVISSLMSPPPWALQSPAFYNGKAPCKKRVFFIACAEKYVRLNNGIEGWEKAYIGSVTKGISEGLKKLLPLAKATEWDWQDHAYLLKRAHREHITAQNPTSRRLETKVKVHDQSKQADERHERTIARRSASVKVEVKVNDQDMRDEKQRELVKNLVELRDAKLKSLNESVKRELGDFVPYSPWGKRQRVSSPPYYINQSPAMQPRPRSIYRTEVQGPRRPPQRQGPGSARPYSMRRGERDQIQDKFRGPLTYWYQLCNVKESFRQERGCSRAEYCYMSKKRTISPVL
jgi:hypothetical protein